MPQNVELTVNGTQQHLSIDPDAPLLHVLRNELGLKATRFGCGVGLCGACFVLLDGHPTPSCDTPMWAAAGRSVVTVEGLSDADGLHPVQRALLAEQAAQCGYCMSGVMISAVALLQASPHPTEQQIVEALDRNLCRCGVHRRIIRAVASVAQMTGSDR